MKEVYTLYSRESSRRSSILEKKKNLHGPRLHTNPDIFCKTTYIFTRLSHTKSASF